jgi:hypothetical protein
MAASGTEGAARTHPRRAGTPRKTFGGVGVINVGEQRFNLEEIDMANEMGVVARHEGMKVMAKDLAGEVERLQAASTAADADVTNAFPAAQAAARSGKDVTKAAQELCVLREKANILREALAHARKEHGEAKMMAEKLAQDRLAVLGPST